MRLARAPSRVGPVVALLRSPFRPVRWQSVTKHPPRDRDRAATRARHVSLACAGPCTTLAVRRCRRLLTDALLIVVLRSALTFERPGPSHTRHEAVGQSTATAKNAHISYESLSAHLHASSAACWPPCRWQSPLSRRPQRFCLPLHDPPRSLGFHRWLKQKEVRTPHIALHHRRGRLPRGVSPSCPSPSGHRRRPGRWSW